MRRKCDMPFKLVKIQMDGRVFMCSAGQPANINAFDVEPNGIWNSPRFLELRQQLDKEQYDPMCQICPLVQSSPDDHATDTLLAGAKLFRLNNENMLDRDGNPIPTNSMITGNVDVITTVNNRMTVTGWACDLTDSVPASIIVIFVGGKTAATTALTLERPDVAGHFGRQQLTTCGFSAEFPSPLPGEQIIVFAIDRNGQAGKIPCSHYSTPVSKDASHNHVQEFKP